MAGRAGAGSSGAAVAASAPAPATVEANERARAVWGEMVGILGSRLTPINRPILVAYCLAVARLEDAQAKLGTVGPLVKRKEVAEVNPLLDVVERELRIVRETAKDLDAPVSPWRTQRGAR